MKNRWNVEICNGAKVEAHHPRGGSCGGCITRLYTLQGYGKRATLDTGFDVSIDDIFKVHEGIAALPDTWRAIFGTLAHNRSFTREELREYVRFDDPIRASAAKALPRLLKLGLIELTTLRGCYYPTSAGWDWIESK